MAGLNEHTPTPIELRVRAEGREFVLCYPDSCDVTLSAEFLRVHSPSAEVRGHGAGQSVLQTGKEDVRISGVLPVGHYAVKIIFSDGHDSGLYSWDILHDFVQNYQKLWLSYLQRLEAAGYTRRA